MKPDQIFAHWKQIRKDLVAMIDQFSQEELSYVPFEGSWTAGRIMLHIADAEDGWFRYAVTQELEQWPEQYTLENFPNKEDIQLALSTVHARTEQYLAGLEESQLTEQVQVPWGASIPLGWIIWHVIEHEIHHRGELSLILGLFGREGLDV